MNIQNELVEYIGTMNENNIEHKYRNTNLLNVAKKIYQLEINEVKTFECKKFTINKYYVELKNGKKRSYLVKIAKDRNNGNIKKCIMFFHGSKDLHWDVALQSTNFLSNEFITIYLQGNNQGNYELEEPHIDKDYGCLSYGQNYFEIRYFADNFMEDIEYVKLVKKDVAKKYSFVEFYAVGHSNGSTFICLFPIFLPNEFIALFSHQGGMGWDEWFYIPFEKLDTTAKKPFVYFYTGTEDIHKIPCIQAHQIFTNEGFESKLYIEENLGHTWKKYHEQHIYDYFLSL